MAVGSDTKAEPLSRGATADDEDDEDSDEDEILETSENGRWQKIAQQVGHPALGLSRLKVVHLFPLPPRHRPIDFSLSAN